MNTFLVSSSNLAFASSVVNVLFTLRSSKSEITPKQILSYLYFRKGSKVAFNNYYWMMAMNSWSSSQECVWALSVFCCVKETRQLTLRVPLLTNLRCKNRYWQTVKENWQNVNGVTCNELAPHPGRVVILAAISCCRN